MRKFFPVLILLFAFGFINAQVEQLTSLRFNPALYFAHKKISPPAHTYKYLVDSGSIIVQNDTLLSLPFIDDFSTNNEPNYLWLPRHVTHVYHNAFGGCLSNEGVYTVEGTFTSTPSWSYSWDYTHQLVDSVPQQPVLFTYFGPATSGCFDATPQTLLYWPAYYTYTFDSATGYPTDSILPASEAADTVTIDFAPVVTFATAQPNTLWFDDYAYVNNTYPINPPTIGVATLDGLNQYGLPYDNSSNSNYGTADYLTSNPIDMGPYDLTDSVYLSFFYEAQGNGDYPDVLDSLIVEFKDQSGFWNIVWSDTGYSSQLEVPDSFQQVLILVDSSTIQNSYYYSGFQFRFRNKASIYGNNNHWNIDYVRLAAHRSATDTVIQDMGFVYPIPTILKNYTLEPARQFVNPTDLVDTINLIIHNLAPNALTNPPATDYTDSATEIYPAFSLVSAQSAQTFNAGPTNIVQILPSTEYTVPAFNTDSLGINSTAHINFVPPGANPVLMGHVNINSIQPFGKVMAYDDGSAEKAYGLTGLDLKKFAYEFDLNKPDTLTGFQVMFAQVEGYVGDLIFNFEAWDTLVLNNYTFIDSPILTIANQAPLYIDSTNGFATYALDTPIIVSNKVYFGWAQTDERRLQVGYDVNSTLGKKHMFIYTEAVWDSSTISPDGSPMIRLIFDSAFGGKTSLSTAVKDLRRDKNNLTVFPNPTGNVVNFRVGGGPSTFEVQVLDALGETVLYVPAFTGQLDMSKFANGVYFLTIKDAGTQIMYHSKVVKTSF